MLSQNHINIISEAQPAWLRLSPNETFVGQGQFKENLKSEYTNRWVIRSLSDNKDVSYYALYNRSKIKLNNRHIQTAIESIKPLDNSGLPTFEYALPAIRPLPLPLIDVLAITDNPSVYAPTTINLIVDIDDDGKISDLTWGSFTLDLPRPADRTSNVVPTLAWDNSDYAIPSNTKQYLVWKKLLLEGCVAKSRTKEGVKLKNSLDFTDPAINSLVKFLNNNETVDLSGKPKNLIKPRVCYRYCKTGEFIPHCNSIRAMAKELVGGMNESITQSPLLALHGNTLRLFNTPSAEGLSYGIVPTMKKGVLLSAFDEFQKHRNGLLKVGDIAIILYRQDGKITPIISIFKQLIKGVDNEIAINAYADFKRFKPCADIEYKILAIDLTSKGSIRCPLSIKLNERDFFEALKRSLNLTTTLSSNKPISFTQLTKLSDFSVTPYVKGCTLQNIKYITGMTDIIGHKFVSDVKKSLDRSSGYEFYMRKHFLKILNEW